MSDLDRSVLIAAKHLMFLYMNGANDKLSIKKQLINLGTYAQRNCSQVTWGIRLDAIML